MDLFKQQMVMTFHITLVIFYWYFVLTVSAKRGQRIDIYSDGGDIKQRRYLSSWSKMHSALPKGSTHKWKLRDSNGRYVIPYVISGEYDSEERQIINRSMKAIEQNTCIRFRKRRQEFTYIDLQNRFSEGCYTSVGRSLGQNIVMLEANNIATCIEYDIVLHELLHAVGLWHEHMRSDRDNFIKVHYESIQPGMYAQFEKVPSTEGDTYGVPYNYRSVMHYAKDAFAKRPGAITMETLDPKFQNIIGKARDAVPSDYYKVCALYDCPVCVGKQFSLEAIQKEDSPNDPENEVSSSDYNDDNQIISDDPYDFFKKAESALGWLISFMMH